MRKIINYFRRSGFIHFFSEVLRHPTKMGSIVPSSRWLAKAMVNALPSTLEGYILEIGPGTGAITAELQKRYSAQKLLIVERSPLFVSLLKKQFPELTIIQGDASHLSELIEGYGAPTAILSSLPLRSLPESLVALIYQHIHTVLPKGGYFIQYTYSWKPEKIQSDAKLQKIMSHRVWLNIPPARVDTYIRTSD